VGTLSTWEYDGEWRDPDYRRYDSNSSAAFKCRSWIRVMKIEKSRQRLTVRQQQFHRKKRQKKLFTICLWKPKRASSTYHATVTLVFFSPSMVIAIISECTHMNWEIRATCFCQNCSLWALRGTLVTQTIPFQEPNS